MGAVAPATFADASKTVGRLAAPQPGSVAPELFHGEKTISGLQSKVISTGTDVVVDTSCRSKNTTFRGRSSQEKLLVLVGRSRLTRKTVKRRRTDQKAKIIFVHGKTGNR